MKNMKNESYNVLDWWLSKFGKNTEETPDYAKQPGQMPDFIENEKTGKRFYLRKTGIPKRRKDEY